MVTGSAQPETHARLGGQLGGFAARGDGRPVPAAAPTAAPMAAPLPPPAMAPMTAPMPVAAAPRGTSSLTLLGAALVNVSVAMVIFWPSEVRQAR